MEAASGGKQAWWQKYSDKPPKFAQDALVFWKGHEYDGIYLVKKAVYIGVPKQGIWAYDIQDSRYSDSWEKKVPEISLYKAN